jgi:NAD-dependent deacetylase
MGKAGVALDRTVDLLARARRPVALTGAGISVDSGIPDFRSPHGLWAIFDPFEYATLSCFLRDPDKAWRLYRALGATLMNKRPNAAHRALADLERGGCLAGIITQNIDGLHQRAGSRVVVEMHGDGRTLHCLGCGRQEPMRVFHLRPGPAPHCPECGGFLKPNVVLFEETVREMDAVADLLRGCDLLLVVETLAEVSPASLLPRRVRAAGGSVVGATALALPRIARRLTEPAEPSYPEWS